MHPNPIYRQTTEADALALARARGFGTLVMNGDPLPLVAQMPFVLNAAGKLADIHLMRSNPVLGALDAPRQALIVVNGPDGYVSPDWYGMANQVPTWNYLSVHLVGTLERRPQDEIRAQVDALSASFETRLAPKPAWTSAKMTPDALDRMLRFIVPVRLSVTEVRSTWKLGQNKPEPARHGAAEGLRAAGIGQETAALADAMDRLPRD